MPSDLAWHLKTVTQRNGLQCIGTRIICSLVGGSLSSDSTPSQFLLSNPLLPTHCAVSLSLGRTWKLKLHYKWRGKLRPSPPSSLLNELLQEGKARPVPGLFLPKEVAALGIGRFVCCKAGRQKLEGGLTRGAAAPPLERRSWPLHTKLMGLLHVASDTSWANCSQSVKFVGN